MQFSIKSTRPRYFTQNGFSRAIEDIGLFYWFQVYKTNIAVLFVQPCISSYLRVSSFFYIHIYRFYSVQ